MKNIMHLGHFLRAVTVKLLLPSRSWRPPRMRPHTAPHRSRTALRTPVPKRTNELPANIDQSGRDHSNQSGGGTFFFFLMPLPHQHSGPDPSGNLADRELSLYKRGLPSVLGGHVDHTCWCCVPLLLEL